MRKGGGRAPTKNQKINKQGDYYLELESTARVSVRFRY